MGAAKVKLRKPLERAIAAGHPWIWRDALDGKLPAAGRVVTVLDKRGKFLGRGLADSGPIGVRIFTLNDEPISDAFLDRRLEAARLLREAGTDLGDTSATRVLNGEGDRLPGVVLDAYGDHRSGKRFGVLRLDGGAAASSWLRGALLERLGPSFDGILEKAARGKRNEVAHGTGPADLVEVSEYGMRLVADLFEGQKTGLFLDHRESRRAVRRLSRHKRVLNLYGYTGGFSIAAALGGATLAVTVDVAKPALEMAKRSFEANAATLAEVDRGGAALEHEEIAADVPKFLAEDSREFDVIVSDPPSFAPNRKAKDKAIEAYSKLHAACMQRLAPQGIYVAASCSSHIRPSDFEASLAEGARRAKRHLQILDHHGAPADHPRLLSFPEGDYLKVYVTKPVRRRR